MPTAPLGPLAPSSAGGPWRPARGDEADYATGKLQRPPSYPRGEQDTRLAGEPKLPKSWHRRSIRVSGTALSGFLAAGFLLACGAQTAPTGPAAGEVAILFVGNSLTYTNGLPLMLEKLLDEHGSPTYVESVAFPNYGLPDHWSDGTALGRIASGGWDVVILQQGPSATEGRPYLLDFSESFAERIRATGGRPALYMVWPASSRSFDFDGVSDSYETAAELVDGLLFPAGEAWRAAWRADPELALYGADGFHPSVLGTYLAAVVMYQQLSGNDPRDLPATIPGTSGVVDSATMDILHQAAVEANAEYARP